MKRACRIISVPILFALFSTQAAQAQWTTAKRLTWNSGQSRMPSVAIDSSDYLHVVWQDETSGNAEIYYKRSEDAGAHWTPAERLTWTTAQSSAPAIAAYPFNVLHVVWSDNTTGNFEVYYKKSPDGGLTWNQTKRLTWNSGNSMYPGVAVDFKTDVHVIWHDDTPGNYEIYYKKSPDGGATWGTAERLTWNSGHSMYPAIAAAAIDPSVGIHVVWHDESPGLPEIYYKGSSDGGETWSAAKRLTWNSVESYDPAIAIDSVHNIHVLWSDDTPDNYEIYYRRSEDGGKTWKPAQRLTWNADGSYEPDVAIDPDDTIHVVWDQGPMTNTEIYYRSSTDGGGTWSAVQRVTWTSLHSYGPAMAIMPFVWTYHVVHLVWYDDTPGNFEIYHKTQEKY